MNMNLQLPRIEIPLSDLEISSLNMRSGMAQDPNIEGLAADISTRGLLAPLVVRETKDDTYEVVCGRRRLYALQKLANGDASQQNVPCVLLPSDQVSARAASLSENINRVPVGPVETYEAFLALCKEGKTHEEIAADFGIPRPRVRAILALGRVHPQIREAAKNGNISHARLRAYAATPDQETQLRLHTNDPEGKTPVKELKAQLTTGTIPADHPLVKFIGIETYQNQGGTVVENLFTYDGEGGVHSDAILQDGGLVSSIAQKLLRKEAEPIQGEGWAKVHTFLTEGEVQQLLARMLLQEKEKESYTVKEKSSMDALVMPNPAFDANAPMDTPGIENVPRVVVVRGLMPPEGRTSEDITQDIFDENREAAMEAHREGDDSTLIEESQLVYDEQMQAREPKDNPTRIRPALAHDLIEIRRDIMAKEITKADTPQVMKWLAFEMTCGLAGDPESLLRDQNRDHALAKRGSLTLEQDPRDDEIQTAQRITNLAQEPEKRLDLLEDLRQTLVQDEDPSQTFHMLALQMVKTSNPSARTLGFFVSFLGLDLKELWRPNLRYFQGFPLTGMALLTSEAVGDARAGRALVDQNGTTQQAAEVLEQLAQGNPTLAVSMGWDKKLATKAAEKMTSWTAKGLVA